MEQNNAKQIFNQDGRVKNTVKTTAFNITNQILTILLSFAYRTIFIYVLSKEYLGLNGLFTDILTLLSLAELGFGSSIVFRLYKPIRAGDVERVAQIMDFFKKVYRIVAIVVTVIGLAIMPLLPFLVQDTTEAQLLSGPNLYIIYGLFLLQTVSGYFFAYKQTLLTADQRGFLLALFNLISIVGKFAGQMCILFLTRSYIWTLAFTVAWTILSNFLISLAITKKYKDVFSLKSVLPKEDQKEILKDTWALLLHRIGTVVVTSTDSIIITATSGLTANGILSNYVLITDMIFVLMTQLYSGLSAGFGNLCATGDTAKIEKVYRNVQFVTMWLSGFISIGLMCLFNPFISTWLGADFVVSPLTVFLKVLGVYMLLTRYANNTLISASGLFAKDKWRPVVEVVLNLGISIGLAQVWGYNGVYIGTVISFAVTRLWRLPHLLYKYLLKKPPTQYWLQYLMFTVLTAAACAACYFAIEFLPGGIWYLLLKFAIVIILSNLIFCIFTCRTEGFRYMFQILRNVFSKFKSRGKKTAAVTANGTQEARVADATASLNSQETIIGQELGGAAAELPAMAPTGALGDNGQVYDGTDVIKEEKDKSSIDVPQARDQGGEKLDS